MKVTFALLKRCRFIGMNCNFLNFLQDLQEMHRLMKVLFNPGMIDVIPKCRLFFQ